MACKERLEEARKLNQKFYADPGSIYATFGKMLESQADIDKPKYDRVTQGTQVNNHTFTKLMKRVVFGEVYGKKRRAETRKQNGSRRLVVPEVPTDGWNLNAEQVTKIIKRKKNWSAPSTVLLISGGRRQLSCIKK